MEWELAGWIGDNLVPLYESKFPHSVQSRRAARELAKLLEMANGPAAAIDAACSPLLCWRPEADKRAYGRWFPDQTLFLPIHPQACFLLLNFS